MEDMEQESSKKMVITIVVVILVIVLGIGGYYYYGNKSSTSYKAPAANDYGTPLGTQGTDANRLEVSDQFPGDTVYIASVTLAQAGFVVVRKNNSGVPGTIIGYAYFKAGTMPGQVRVSPNTADGQTYFAELYADTGDKAFSEASDTLLKDSKGSAIRRSFKATMDIPDVKG